MANYTHWYTICLDFIILRSVVMFIGYREGGRGRAGGTDFKAIADKLRNQLFLWSIMIKNISSYEELQFNKQ